MKLHLLRHAKTHQATPGQNDYDRKLLPKGIKQARALSEHISDLNANTEVWCSSAVRTRETLSILQGHIALKNVTFLDELYLCSKTTFLKMLWKSDSTDDLIIVGHNFGISDLASYFLDDDIELRTGEYICIDFKNYSRNETSKGLGVLTERWRYNK